MLLRCCSGMRGAGAAAEGQARCRGGAARVWAVEGSSSSSSGAERRRARRAAAGWRAGPCVSGPARGLSGRSHSSLGDLQRRPAWSCVRGAPGVFLLSPHTCRVQQSQEQPRQ